MCSEFSREDGNRNGSLLGRGLEVLCVNCFAVSNAESQGIQVSSGEYFLQISLTNPFSNKVFRSWIEFLVRVRDRTSALLTGNGSYLNK